MGVFDLSFTKHLKKKNYLFTCPEYIVTRDVAAKRTEETNKEQMLHDMEEQALEDYKVFWKLVFYL